MIAPTLPHWVQIAVLGIGGVLLVLSIVLGVVTSRTKRDKAAISVKMGDRNKISRIGSDHGGRQG